MEEEYRIIKGFDNYSVSNFGNVRNNKTLKILKQGLNNNGYKIVCIINNDSNKPKTNKVHRLVAQAFSIPNPLNKELINHIDGNKLNNNINNLRWASRIDTGNNKSMSKNNTSGFKGVQWNKKLKKWRVMITINGKKTHIGYYENKDEAIESRVKIAQKTMGEFINKCEKVSQKRKELNKEIQELEELEKEFEALL